MAVVITAAHGVVIKLWNAAAFTAIDGIFNGPNGPGWNTQFIEARHHGSTTSVKKATFVDVENVTFSIYYDSGDTIHAALLTAAKNKTLCSFQMELQDTGAEKYGFDAYVSMSFKGENEGFNVYDVTLILVASPAVS